MTGVLFYVAAAAMLVFAVMVISARSPLRAALYLIVTLCCGAALYVTLAAPFVAAMQVLVYAGAIMVLFIFVIMLLNLDPARSRPASRAMARVLGAVAIAALGLRLFLAVDFSGSDTAGKAVDGSVAKVGSLLLTDYLFAFEAISVLLLVAVVGGVVLAMRRLN